LKRSASLPRAARLDLAFGKRMRIMLAAHPGRAIHLGYPIALVLSASGTTCEVNLQTILDDLHARGKRRGFDYFVMEVARSSMDQDSPDVLSSSLPLNRLHVAPNLLEILDSWSTLLALHDHGSL